VTKSVLAVSDSRNIIRLLARSLTPAGWELSASNFKKQQALDRLSDYTMCILDADGPPDTINAMLDHLYDTQSETIALLLSHDTNSPFMRNLLRDQPLNNLIAKQGGISAVKERIDETELIVTCQKLFAKDIFGLEKYIATWGVQSNEHRITSTADKKAALRQLRNYLQKLDCYSSINNSVLWVADELLMNAMFNAPRDAEGKPKYADHDRSNLQLESGEAVSMKYCCDGRHIALSVRDPFGSLDREVMLKYLNRCLGNSVELEEREAGAGLGLYIVFNSITQLAFNIHAGVATEVIALFYIRAGPRAFNGSGKSLNIFLLQ
jgi:hypothetical protein